MDFIEAHREEHGFLFLGEEDYLPAGCEIILAKHSGGFEWSAFIAFARDGRLYWTSDSGCSCVSFGERIYSSADLESGREGELVAAYKRWAAEEYNPALTNEERVSAHRDITQAIKDYKKKVKK